MPENPPNMRIAALVGNGLSVAYNRRLALPTLTANIRNAMDGSAGPDGPARLLQSFAAQAQTDDPETNFEALLGPLDLLYNGISLLGELSTMVNGTYPKAKSSINLVADILTEVRRLGVSHALESIAKESKNSWARSAGMDEFVGELLAASDGQMIHIGNLNYDSLLMAALSGSYPFKFCDMTDGRQTEVHEVLPDVPMLGRPLRQTADFPVGRPIRLLHLHGSLAWLKQPEGNVFRFEIGALRAHKYWKAWREGRTDWSPQVVLTNQNGKNSLVKEAPFALGYEVFGEALLDSDRWLIVGYGFGDECVNEMLGQAFARRDAEPEVLVITHGDAPSRAQILGALGLDEHLVDSGAKFLTIDRSGVPTALSSGPWKTWASGLEANAA